MRERKGGDIKLGLKFVEKGSFFNLLFGSSTKLMFFLIKLFNLLKKAKGTD